MIPDDLALQQPTAFLPDIASPEAALRVRTHTPAALNPTGDAAPLRIALLGYRSHPYSGGQGIYLHYLSKALLAAGHRVDVISGPPYPHLMDGVRLIKLPSLDLFENGLGSLQFHHLRSWSNIVEWSSKLSGGFAEPYSFGRRALRYLRSHRNDYDIVHDNQSLSYGLLRLQTLGVPLLATVHHPITSDLRLALAACADWRERLLVRRWHSFLTMQQRVVRRLHHVVTVSECARRDIARDFGIAAERIDVVHNGIDTEVFAPRPTIARRPLRIMATASADAPLKGLRYLLAAYAALLVEQPALELLVVGSPRPDGPTATLCKDLGITDRVQFVSRVSTAELVDLYAEATLAVVPSLYEGFGLPAGEAMACGVPLISSDGGALPEVVGDAALVVPAGNAEALAAAIRQLLADPKRRAALGARGRAHVQHAYRWDTVAQRLVTRYRQVIADANG